MYSALRSESPHARRPARGGAKHASAGVIRRHAAARRFQTLCAALTEICWPTIERASVVNGSPRRASVHARVRRA